MVLMAVIPGLMPQVWRIVKPWVPPVVAVMVALAPRAVTGVLPPRHILAELADLSKTVSAIPREGLVALAV